VQAHVATVIAILLTLTGTAQLKMKNYHSLTVSRMRWELLVFAAAVFEFYLIVELLLK
jgi:hypothetical protein